METLNKENNEIYASLTAVEKEISRLDQYGRRENIEILNIPKTVDDDKLEETVIKIFKSLGLGIDKFSIVGCHRIKRKTRNNIPSVIVRFLHRKDAIDCMSKRKEIKECGEKMGFKNLFIVENLCPSYSSIFEQIYKKKEWGEINNVWTNNGVINVKFTKNSKEKPTKIYHSEDYDYYFSDDFSYD